MSSETIGLMVDIPVELYKRFKIRCIQEGQSIKSVILEFVSFYAEEEKSEPSKKSSGEDEKKED